MSEQARGDVVAVLERLLTHWKRLQLPMVGELRPGLDDATIDELTSELGLRLPEELRAMYRWRDGVDSVGFSRVYGRFIFRSLEDAVFLTRAARKVAEQMADEAGTTRQENWPDTWLQVFDTDAADGAVAQCGDDRTAPTRYFSWGTPETFASPPATGSVAALLGWWADIYDRDGVSADERGRLTRKLSDRLLPPGSASSGLV